MVNQTSINIELGIDARKIMQQVRLNNEALETQVSKGLELALEDIANGDNFVQTIRENTKKELLNIVDKAVMSWELRNKISKLVEEKVGKKIEEYADKIADQITSSLK